MALTKLDQLYRQVILDHSNHPHHKGLKQEEIEPSHLVEMNNPTCGDVIQLQLFVDDDENITDVRFDGHGCSISMASASMMSDLLIGKNMTEAKQLSKNFSKLVQGESVEEEPLEDAALLSGVAKFPARIKCATLAWKAFERATEKYGKE